MLGLIANNLTNTLNFLDISYCKAITDEGLAHFSEKTYPLDSLIINGCNGISGAGLKQMLHSFKDTLLELECAFNDQASFNSSFFETLGFCFNLETLDVSGSNDINDDGGRALTNASVTVGNETVKPGLSSCITLKISGSNIGDATMPLITKAMPNLEHVELVKCEAISEFGVNCILQNCEKVIFLDIAKIPIFDYAFLDELR